ncbi:MAG: hypothetical protein EOO14_25140 [Chitinophagaceae bacterium]|nr:MAG: hypothetical protein EOO14_25140 [Chitinophagaceae bacterium]
MKKLFSIFLLAGIFTACNSDSTTDGNGAAPVTPGIDNVNGNVPDTSETIRLNNPLPTDSTTGITDTSSQR